MKAKAEEP
jgi:hypothetical protein